MEKQGISKLGPSHRNTKKTREDTASDHSKHRDKRGTWTGVQNVKVIRRYKRILKQGIKKRSGTRNIGWSQTVTAYLATARCSTAKYKKPGAGGGACWV